MTMEKIIRIENLKKSFGEIKAVDDLSFDVDKGSLFAFLGLNGAGKSTTINIICTLLKKDSGKVFVSGIDLDKDPVGIRNKTGVVFQNSILDETLSVYDNLSIRASLYGIYGAEWKERLSELDALLSLKDLYKRPYGKLSGGQRRRVDVARGLVNSPEILILDEPTTGLDPQTRKTVWEVIEKLRADSGMTVFLTTHYMEEARGADKVVILDSGKIAASGTPISLKNEYSKDRLVVYRERSKEADEAFEGYAFRYDNNAYNVFVENGDEAKKLLIHHSDIICDFEFVKGDMDDVFLNVTGKKLTGGEQ